MSETVVRLPSTLAIPYERYAQGARVGARAHLDDVRVHSIQADLEDWGAISSLLRPDISVDVQVTPTIEGGTFVVAATYVVTLTKMREGHEEDEDGADSRSDSTPAVSVSVGLAGLYGSDELPQDLEDEELEAFAVSAGMLALHPYARELVSSVIQRFGLPPLVIPPLRVVSDEPLTGA